MHELIIADSGSRVPDDLLSVIRQVHQELMITSLTVCGRELLDVICRKRPDLVVVDLLLSGMNGLDVIRQTREMELQTHFIVVSAQVRFEDIRTAVQLGVDDFLFKPLKPLELQNSVSRVLQKMEADSKGQTSSAPGRRDLECGYVERTKRWIEKHYAEPVSLKAAASEIYLHPTYLGFLFKKEVGVSFTEYLTQRRIEAAKQCLSDPGCTAAQAAKLSGYRDVKYFCKVFRKKTGLSPVSFQKQKREKMIQ